MKAIPKIIIPEGLNLGDITGVKVGDEVTIIGTLTGSPVVGASCSRISEITKDGYVRVGKLGGFWLKYGGGAYYFMYHGFFFYSANPAHIAEAKENAKKEQAEAQAAAEARAKIMAVAYPIGVALGDGEREDEDGGHWQSSEVADAIAEKLTIEQMRQLAEWLGVEIGSK